MGGRDRSSRIRLANRIGNRRVTEPDRLPRISYEQWYRIVPRYSDSVGSSAVCLRLNHNRPLWTPPSGHRRAPPEEAPTSPCRYRRGPLASNHYHPLWAPPFRRIPTSSLCGGGTETSAASPWRAKMRLSQPSNGRKHHPPIPPQLLLFGDEGKVMQMPRGESQCRDGFEISDKCVEREFRSISSALGWGGSSPGR